MHPYQNKSGKSGVTAYEMGEDYIKVRFHSKDIYIYSYKKPGKHHVEAMKQLAIKGLGLSTYISQYIAENYFSKEA